MKARVEARVATLSALGEKPRIDYPILWEYKVIFEADTSAKTLFDGLFGEREFTHAPSKHSKSGKYQSHSLKILVMSEDERLEIFNELKKRAKFVI